MKLVRKGLILSHRYLGIAISLLVAVWFASGIVMMYAGGMPQVAPELRLERLAPLDPSRIRLTLAEAAEAAGFDASAGWSGSPLTLFMLMDRPAYRFGDEAIVFADTGEVLEGVTIDEARAIAGRFANVSLAHVRFLGTLSEVDQWTLGQSRRMPQYKFAVDDGAGTEIYVQAATGDVSMLTTSRSRLLAWLGVIPHWLYFAPLRVNQPLWYDIVVATSALACVLTVIGLIIGVMKFGRPKPFRLSAAIPYAGWMRWHYVTGAVFGLFTLTFAFSGMLSMEPYSWTNARSLDLPRNVLEGGAIELTAFPRLEPAIFERAVGGRATKQVEFTRIHGEHHYVVRTEPDPRIAAAQRERLHQPYIVSARAQPDRLLISAETMAVRSEPFSVESLVARLKEAVPDTPILEQTLLTDYDSYYYSRRQLTPLPVLRVKFDDPLETWVYVDPAMSRVLAEIHRLNRIERWLYNGLHSLDFSFWYDRRPLWDIGMITLLLGGLVSSGIGFFLGLGRIRRAVGRKLALFGRAARAPAAEPAGSSATQM